MKKNLSECEDEKVEEFSLVMSKILKWLQLCLDIRCEDVVRRRDAVEVAKQERENAIKQDNARKEKYEKELEEKTKAHDDAVAAEMQKQYQAQCEEAEANGTEAPAEPDPATFPKIKEDEFKQEFDLANAEIHIPDEVQDEVDNDYDLPYNPPAPAAE